MEEAFLVSSHKARLAGPGVQEGKIPDHLRSEYPDSPGPVQFLGNPIQGLVLDHPAMPVEGLQIQGDSVSTQSFFPLQVVELLEVRHDQLAYRPIDRFPKSKSHKVRFTHSTPMHFLFEKGQEMVVVPAIGEHFQDQGGVPDAAEHCRGKEGAVVAVGHPLSQNSKRATVNFFG